MATYTITLEVPITVDAISEEEAEIIALGLIRERISMLTIKEVE